MKRCTRCILPETFPGIQFDAEGVCQYCRRAPTPEVRVAQRQALRTQFETLVQAVRERPGYHGLVAWSGGKDSTYTVWLLKEQYGLNLLTFTFDNGFVSPAAWTNLRTVSETLGVDHLIVKPRFDLLRAVFARSGEPGLYPPRALERASGICNSCMGLAKGVGLRLALEREIPLLIYGWSPGQVPLNAALFRLNRALLRTMVQAAVTPLEQAAGPGVRQYFPDAALLERTQEYPYNTSPLALVEYDEARILDIIQPLGWRRPEDTDPNSTNCLLNSLANTLHLRHLGYHPYEMELSGLVRDGVLTRAEALSRLAAASSAQVVQEAARRLGLAELLA